ncbi:hypothetical protein mRhiFer1_010080 [Rhinolophus ferrumequinum]|uniref:Uncharacterized protein n=1 Tax=Rhinolophus ferrumequinum TaxID=59479 RepID=A0A7J7Y5G1_RHIFE|nr:hypothetical protein mRhiFer1_010080 [Rhinolophus ferrumequinum]
MYPTDYGSEAVQPVVSGAQDKEGPPCPQLSLQRSAPASSVPPANKITLSPGRPARNCAHLSARTGELSGPGLPIPGLRHRKCDSGPAHPASKGTSGSQFPEVTASDWQDRRKETTQTSHNRTPDFVLRSTSGRNGPGSLRIVTKELLSDGGKLAGWTPPNIHSFLPLRVK